jgi:hypothetical protein
MAHAPLGTVLRHLRTLAGAAAPAEDCDDLYVMPPATADYLGLADALEIPAGRPEVERVLKVPRGTAVNCRVLDEETGRGIAGVELLRVQSEAGPGGNRGGLVGLRRARVGPPHLSTYRNSANLLRSHRPEKVRCVCVFVIDISSAPVRPAAAPGKRWRSSAQVGC